MTSRRIKIVKILSVLLFLITLSACSKPDFQDVEGNDIYLKDLNEKWLIVNYWATWCAPCRIEIPELNELSLEQKDRVTVLGVNFDQPSMSELPQQVKSMKIEFPVLQNDPSAKLGVTLPEVLPTTYVFRPGGALLKMLIGPQSKDDLVKLINES